MGGDERGIRSRWSWTASLVAMLAIRLSLPAATLAGEGPPAPSNERTFSSGYKFVEMSGEELFSNVCQGCHMPDGQGPARDVSVDREQHKAGSERLSGLCGR